MTKRIMLLACSLLLTVAVQAQNLKKDSLRVQKILKEEGGKKTAPAVFIITDKERN